MFFQSRNVCFLMDPSTPADSPTLFCFCSWCFSICGVSSSSLATSKPFLTYLSPFRKFGLAKDPGDTDGVVIEQTFDSLDKNYDDSLSRSQGEPPHEPGFGPFELWFPHGPENN